MRLIRLCVPPFLVKLDGIEELRYILYDAIQFDICWLSIKNFECFTPRSEQRVEVIGDSHGTDCPVGLWRDLLSSFLLYGGRNRYRGTWCLVITDL